MEVTPQRRALTEASTQLRSAEMSERGKLFGLGTGNLTITDSFSLGCVLWFRNDAIDQNIHVQKIIFGWNGGSTNFNRTVFSLIHYKTGEPSAENTSINDAVENISLTGSTAKASGLITAHRWDGGAAAGMTVSGGFAQIPNRLAQGDKTKDIEGEIILGPGDAMDFRVTPEETGEFHVSVVYFFKEF